MTSEARIVLPYTIEAHTVMMHGTVLESECVWCVWCGGVVRGRAGCCCQLINVGRSVRRILRLGTGFCLDAEADRHPSRQALSPLPIVAASSRRSSSSGGGGRGFVIVDVPGEADHVRDCE